jgi:hypothetical protein
MLCAVTRAGGVCVLGDEVTSSIFTTNQETGAVTGLSQKCRCYQDRARILIGLGREHEISEELFEFGTHTGDFVPGNVINQLQAAVRPICLIDLASRICPTEA